MSNYEHIKTGLLIGLVGLSMILTWKLWTFQPDIALLDEETKYIPSEAMSEERKLRDIVHPEQMVVHLESKHALIMPDDAHSTQLYEHLLQTNVNVDEYRAVELSKWQRDGIEMIFPTAIPTDVFLSLFQVDPEEAEVPLVSIERLLLYGNQYSEKIHMQLYSSKDDELIDIETDFSLKDFDTNYMSSFTNFIEATKVEGDFSIKEEIEALYISTDPVIAKRLSYTVSPIPGKFFRQSLFTDPDSVKYYRQSDNEESYTDGNRIINIRNNGLFMEYNNPVYSEAKDKSRKHIVHRSYEFINGHGGWTDEYLLNEWNESKLRDEAEYRLHVNHYPVISFEGADQMMLRISRSGNQTESYRRPLFYLEGEPIDAKEEVTLPSGQAVIDRMKEQEYFVIDHLQKLKVGYEMTMPSRSFVTVEPHWFILYDGRWQKVTFAEDEGGM